MSQEQFDWAESISDVIEHALAGLPPPPSGVTDIRMGLEYDDQDEPSLWFLDWSVDHGEHWSGSVQKGASQG